MYLYEMVRNFPLILGYLFVVVLEIMSVLT